MANNIHLVDAFRSWDLSLKVCENLLNQADADPTVALLALEGLCRIESEVKRGQFWPSSCKRVADLLQRWRNENDLGEYSWITKKVLKELTIFENCGIPLFIDNYGKKNLISSYEETVDVDIGLDEPIYHVTHLEEARNIVESSSLIASDNKNIIKGSWFGLWSPRTVYGSQAVGTTLSKLNVRGLRQGEIVSYKQEVNVILYADVEGNTDTPKRPTDKAAKEYHGNDGMYVKVSIFVPEKFLPKPQDFGEVICGPIDVLHTPFCVRQERTRNACFELQWYCLYLCEKLLNQVDPTVALLSLEGLFRIESEVEEGSLDYYRKDVRDLLQRWRNETVDHDLPGYGWITDKVLRQLTIFKTHEVPLFIDNYGKRNHISSYEETVDVDIGVHKPIYHVTHLEEARNIVESSSFKASDNKNIIKGSWFGLWSPQSVYGSKAFGTTLSKLNVGGLRQGEIVSYKHEVNVILYADDKGDTDRPKRPTDKAAKEYHGNDGMYVKVSIFVPEKFLPKPQDFGKVICGPFDVLHTPFCVREKRTRNRCAELRSRFYNAVFVPL